MKPQYSQEKIFSGADKNTSRAIGEIQKCVSKSVLIGVFCCLDKEWTERRESVDCAVLEKCSKKDPGGNMSCRDQA